MKNFFPALLLTVSGTMISYTTLAEEVVLYTSDEYCSLENKVETKNDQQYLNAYSEKLGEKHSKKFCKKINKENAEAAESKMKKQWNYANNRPYRDSIRRLPVQTVAKLRALNISEIE